MKTLLRSVLLFCLLFSSVSAPTVTAMGQREARAAFLPEECVTKSVINPRTPGWVFVLNFEKLVNNTPVGCLMFYRTIFEPTDFAPIICKLVSNGSDLSFLAGRATFSGGYVYCPINIKETLATFTPTIIISDVNAYPYFSIISVANPIRLAKIDDSTHPVGYYQPDNRDYHVVGLNFPLSVGGGYMVSTYNGITNTGTFTNALENTKEVTILSEHTGDGADVGTYTMTHYLENVAMDAFGPRTPVTFWSNGGAFWIGASPLNLTRYEGTLDEVIFDPPDGGRPPSSPSRFKLYLPLGMVQ